MPSRTSRALQDIGHSSQTQEEGGNLGSQAGPLLVTLKSRAGFMGMQPRTHGVQGSAVTILGF